MAKPKKRKANPRIRSKKRANPRITKKPANPKIRLQQLKRWALREEPTVLQPKHIRELTRVYRNQQLGVDDIDFTKYGNARHKLIQILQDELAEARWQRQYAYSIRHSPVYLRGVLFDAGLKHGSEHDLRRTMCDMWVSCLHRLHKLILGLAPEPDATELEYPIKIATLPSRAHTLHT